MLSGEDFGYLKDDDRSRMGVMTKKTLLIGAVLFSISCFVYITINAYYFAYHDQNNNIKVIKSPDFPIKVMEEQDPSQVHGIDKSVYDSIIGNKNLARENLNSAKVVEPANAPVVVRNQNRPNTNYGTNINTKDAAQIIQNKTQNRAPQKINSSGIVVYDAGNTGAQDNVSVINLSKKNDTQSTAMPSAMPATNQPSASTKPVKGTSRVQLAALSSRSAATEYWSKLKNSYPHLLSGYNYFVQDVNLGARGTFYRLQIGNFKSQVDAEKFCSQFISQTRKSRADCIIVE